MFCPQIALEERVLQLEELSGRRAVIRLDNKKFQTYVKSIPRNYSIVIMMTALQGHRQCGACRYTNFAFLTSLWVVYMAQQIILFVFTWFLARNQMCC